MRLLLDTHALLWTVLASPLLSRAARQALSDPQNEVLISAVSIFEITLKHRIGKLQEAAVFAVHHQRLLADLEWTPLPIAMTHASLAGGLDIPHKDPFDRLLIAQSRIEQVPLVSNEALFDSFGVNRLW